MKRELFQVSEQSCNIAVYDMLPGSNAKWTWEVRSAGAGAAVTLVAAAQLLRCALFLWGAAWTVAKACAV